MSNESPVKVKGIQKSDILSSAAITSITTFILLTWSKTLPDGSIIAPYLTEQIISFSAGLISFFVTIALSYLRYEIRLICHERDYTKKIKYLNQIIEVTTCSKAKEELEMQKNELLKSAATAIIEEKI